MGDGALIIQMNINSDAYYWCLAGLLTIILNKMYIFIFIKGNFAHNKQFKFSTEIET